jgi:putative protease
MIETSDDFFVPSSLLNGMRREATERLITVRCIRFVRTYVKRDKYNAEIAYPSKSLDCSANVSNRKAVEFYKRHHAEVLEPAFEVKMRNHVPLMTTKHCLLYSMGWCPVHHKKQSPYREPYSLIYKDIRLRLSFDCKKCRMLVSISPEK